VDGPAYCARCASNCLVCTQPGSCDKGGCAAHHARVLADLPSQQTSHPPSHACKACSKGCHACSDPSPAGCTECRLFYAKLSSGGGCTFSWAQLATCHGAVAALFFSGLACCARQERVRARQRRAIRIRRIQEAEDGERARLREAAKVATTGHLSAAEGDAATGGDAATSSIARAAPFPSGAWRGFYSQDGNQHGVCEFALHFRPDGSVRGKGCDDVGAYTLRGSHTGAFVSFTKQYLRSTNNAAGRRNHENAGHAVLYDGGPAAVGADGLPDYGRGMRGKWAIRHPLGDSDGHWHLWPIMDGWARAHGAPEAHTGHSNGTGAESQGAAAARGTGAGPTVDEDEFECVVCYDAPIDRCLEPCGHVAVCGACAERLKPRRCPLCRTDIQRVDRVQRRGTLAQSIALPQHRRIDVHTRYSEGERVTSPSTS